MRYALSVSVMVLASVASAAAQQTVIDPAANAKLGALRQATQANPYGRLFDVREALRQATADASRTAAPAPKRRVVCGMTVIEVGPESDPKMAVTPPKDDNVTYTIRAIDPPICNPAK